MHASVHSFCKKMHAYCMRIPGKCPKQNTRMTYTYTQKRILAFSNTTYKHIYTHTNAYVQENELTFGDFHFLLIFLLIFFLVFSSDLPSDLLHCILLGTVQPLRCRRCLGLSPTLKLFEMISSQSKFSLLFTVKLARLDLDGLLHMLLPAANVFE